MKTRRIFVPEVVQTSAMDCGPASLKCLLEGFGIHVSYGRLREACQTDVDGTSIDTMEEAAVQLGLNAEQIMVPWDHVLLPEAKVLPAIVVVQLANGVTHFVVIWRRHGPLVQLMDPGTGRRWITSKRFIEELYLHTQRVPAAGWREWAGTEPFLNALRRRMSALGISSRAAGRLVERGLADPEWRTLGALDAGVRLTNSLVESGGFARGRQAAKWLDRLIEHDEMIPETSWSVRPATVEPDGEPELLLRGAVLVSVRGRREVSAETSAAYSPELKAALTEAPSRPGRELLRLLRQDGVFAPAALLLALAVASGGVVLEAVLLRGVVDLGRELGVSGQRMGAASAMLGFAAFLLLLEWPLAVSMLRWGRRLETRLRMAFLEKIPRLGDRYFQSRLTSDMAERSHSLQQIRHLPDLGSQLTRGVFELALTTAGIVWLDPASWPIACAAAAVAIVLPLATQPVLMERDLRVRSHLGALSRFYLDALLGLVAIRAHGAERAVRREHEDLLVEWARAGFRLQRTAVWVEAVQLTSGYGLAAWLLIDHLTRTGAAGTVLLLVYWALNLPAVGQQIAQVAWQYPGYRNVTLRLMEPLGALEEDTDAVTRRGDGAAENTSGIAVALEGVTVRAAGHTILEGIDVSFAAGEHVAIVGPSGAGKSSLVGLMLGWHRAAVGTVRIDGTPLEGARLETLRREIAWVDPAVQLWNRSFAENLSFGADSDLRMAVGTAIEAADLRSVLEKLPDGLQTRLGEGGALVSGGEGQRVRLGRALLRPGVQLVILDEPFRGLDREKRRELLARARKLWRDATFLCITHDLSETMAFGRVLVIEQGHIVEDGVPAKLAQNPASRYRALLDAEQAVVRGLWSDKEWRRLWLESGELVEQSRTEGTAV
ncbi:MAG TPA: ATP-binding cassette domain-containing protein [Bryobacteraceae bacterium]|nr:ATP-binding cassette domain-containing protein [Bryobacteraceae bacterium]